MTQVVPISIPAAQALPSPISYEKSEDFDTSHLVGNKSFFQIIKEPIAKKVINGVFNGSSAALNFAAFLNAQFGLYDFAQEYLEKSAELLTKAAYNSIGIIGSIDVWEKKNLIPFLGFAMGIPLTVLSSGYDVWLMNGIPYGFGNFIIVTDQRELVDKNGSFIKSSDGKVKLLGGDFKELGWGKGLSKTLEECRKMVFEITEKPKKLLNSVSHALLASSVFELFGPVVYMFGQEKIGSFIRSTGTIATQTAMLFHDDSSSEVSEKKRGKISLTSDVSKSAVLGVTASMLDFIKRTDFISDKIPNLTNLTLGIDRVSNYLIMSGIFNIKKN